jgi:PhnB protein
LAPSPAFSVEVIMRRSDNIIPELCVHDGLGALEFYRRAFGAVEQKRMMGPDGAKLLHAELTIGGHRLVVFDECTPRLARRAKLRRVR